MRSKRPSPLRFQAVTRLGVALFAAALLTACATTGPDLDRFDPAGWATAGQAIQVRVTSPALTLVRDSSKPSAEWADLLSRVDTLWLGLPDPVQTGNASTLARLRVGVEGRFAPVETAWALFWNRPPAPWVVVQPRDGTLLVSQSSPRLDATPLSDEAGTWTGSDVRLVWDRPGPSLLGPLASRFVDLRRLVVELQARENQLTGQVRLELPDDRAASTATVLLRLFGADLQTAWQQNLEWHTEGSSVIGEPLVVTRGVLAQLLLQLTQTEAP